MMPPADVCRRMYETDAWARIAWAGRERTDEERFNGDESLNLGRFILVKLLHKADRETSIQERWTAKHGPLFSRRGKTRPDYNTTTYIPVWTGEFSVEEVYSGRCVSMLKDWNRPWLDRQRTNLKLASQDLTDQRLDLSEAMADEMVFNSNKTGAQRPEAVPYKSIPKEDLAVLHGDVDESPTDHYAERLKQLEHDVLHPGGRIT